MSKKNRLFDITVKNLPLKFLEEIISRINWCYKESDSRVRNDIALGQLEADYMRGHHIWSLCHKKFQEAGQSAGLDVNISENSTKNHSYALVKTGDFALTISHVDSPKKVPQSAKFRSQHADINQFLPQLFLFKQKHRLQKGNFYALILHGTTYEGQSSPFIRVAFPNEECKGYVANFDIYDVLEAKLKIQESQAKDIPDITAKPKPKWKINPNAKEGEVSK